MEPGALVIVDLVHPSEKYWGQLVDLRSYGLTLRGIHLASFNDLVHEVATQRQPSIGLATVFFPFRRLERMTLDERVGEVESYAGQFEQRTGMSPAAYLEGS